MRLALVFLPVVLALATNAGKPDVSGVWVAVIDDCDFGTAPRPVQLLLNVTRSENRLDVIELSRGEDKTDLRKREYALAGGAQRIRSAVGSAKSLAE